MSFSSLKATVTQIHETNEDAITIDGSDDILTPVSLLGTALVDMFLTTAKDELKTDIRLAVNLDPNDSDDDDNLDDIVTYNELFLKLSLRDKQLELFYGRFNDGVDSFSYSRHLYYKGKYSNDRAKFAQLKTDSGYMLSILRAKVTK